MTLWSARGEIAEQMSESTSFVDTHTHLQSLSCKAPEPTSDFCQGKCTLQIGPSSLSAEIRDERSSSGLPGAGRGLSAVTPPRTEDRDREPVRGADTLGRAEWTARSRRRT